MAFLEPNSATTTTGLEQKYQPAYSAWQKTPNPDSMSALLQTVKPEIDRGIVAYVGQANPAIRSRAKGIAIKAIKSYDPTKARLGTHIVNQLQGLKRIARQQSQVLSIPERVSLDLGHIERARNELADKIGRDPNNDELADATGLSSRRLTYIQSFRHPVAEGTLSHIQEGDEGGGFSPAVDTATGSPKSAWHEFVYADLDPTNKKIMEWSLGMHGSKPLSNMDIARKLRVTSGAVSQRKAKIQKLLDQQNLSPF